MSRFPPIAPEQRDAAQTAMAERATPGGPFEMYQRSPQLWELLQPLRHFFPSRYPARWREIVILAVAAHWRSQAAIASHSRLALAAGIDAATIDAILTGVDPALDEPERLLLACTRALLAKGRLSDALFAQAQAVLGATALVDLTGMIAFYTGLSLVLNLGEDDPAPLSA